MSTRRMPSLAPWLTDRLARYGSRRVLVTSAVALLVGTAGWVTLGVSNAATGDDAVAVGPELAEAFSTAARSCSALTPARLAAQVMATTRFQPTPEGGIGGLTAAQWKTWSPFSGASPGDASASVLALAHLTCDQIGQVRVQDVPGDPWRLAVAALRSSVAAVRTADGIPAGVAAFVGQVDAYVAYYDLQPGLGERAAPAPATPTATATGTAPPSANPTSTATPSPTPTSTAPPTAVAPSSTGMYSLPDPVRFSHNSFQTATMLRLNGSARVADAKLHLAAGSEQAGSAWSTSTIDPTRSFATTFVAEITKITDGVAFVVQKEAPDALGGFGGGLGYGARPGDPPVHIAPSVAVELDTWDNSPDGFDPAGHQHIAVTTNGDITQHLAWGDPGFSMYGSGPVRVWIAYDAGQHVLTVHASQASAMPASPLFSLPIDLAAVLGSGRAYVGFTGGTGLTSITDAEESILSWTFEGQ